MRVLTGKMMMAAIGCACLCGCASIGPPMPPSLELPKPPSDLRASRKGDKVTLTWTVPQRTTDRQSLRYLGETRICRSLDASANQCDRLAGSFAPTSDSTEKRAPDKKLVAVYTDLLPAQVQEQNPKLLATYAVEVLNTAGRAAGLSNKASVPTVPVLPPFPEFSARTTAQGVMLSWHCPQSEQSIKAGTQYRFRIYRKLESAGREARIAELDATECATGSHAEQPAGVSVAIEVEHGELATSFLDQTLEWEKTYLYRGTVVSVVVVAGKPPLEVEGDDTPEVRVFAHDIFPPAVPSELQAVYSGPGQRPFIDLVWSPVTDADLAGYNVYRHEAGAAPVKVNAGLVGTPAFRDEQVSSGRAYFYSVTAVDQRGNESGRSQEAEERVP